MPVDILHIFIITLIIIAVLKYTISII